MPQELLSPTFWNELGRMPSPLNEDWLIGGRTSGLQISEDDTHLYVEAQLPGLTAKEIDVHFERGTLTIRGESDETASDKQRKHYRRFQRTFSYQVAVPATIREQEPEATLHNGILSVSFTKEPTSQPKQIHIKTERSA